MTFTVKIPAGSFAGECRTKAKNIHAVVEVLPQMRYK